MLERRSRIAAALLMAPVVRDLVVAIEDVPSVACEIDREIETISRGEAGDGQREMANAAIRKAEGV